MGDCLARRLPVLAFFLVAYGVVGPAEARITRIEITSRVVFAGGMSFGATGPYEKLRGRFYGEVAPTDPLNAVILDLDKAPRNGRGMVEYVSDFLIIKPVNMGKGNGKIFYGINNRGNTGAISGFNDATTGGNDPTTAQDAGNGFLMRQGYAIVDAGWEGDILAGDSRLTARYPTVTGGGAEMTGTIFVQFDVSRHIPPSGAVSLPLNRANFDSYEPVSLDTSTARLTARDLVQSPETLIPSNRWAFAACTRNPATGAAEHVVASRKDICYFDGFNPNKLYQLTYTARNPRPMALGYAATRDVGSFLRFQVADDLGAPNPLAIGGPSTGISQMYGYGSSSTGMYVRDFLYLGFNENETHRKVFDAMWTNIPGALRLHQNTRFSMPDIYSRQDLWNGLWPMATFPFSYGKTADPVTGRTDGILKRPATDPIVFHTDSSEEYWQFHAALVTTDGRGNDIPLPDNVRLYLMSSGQHGPAAVPVKDICQQLTNPLRRGSINRALLVALDAWVTKGILPPESRYPRVDNGTLGPPDQASTGFPAIPGVSYSGLVHSLPLRSYGSSFSSTGGVIDIMPPATVAGAQYKILVPKVDKDGNDIAGIRVPELDVPLATYTGWNLRAAGFRQGELCALNGMYIPFARTRAERLAKGDPRESLEERYKKHDIYVKGIEKAARTQVKQRLLLEEDADRILAAATASDVLR